MFSRNSRNLPRNRLAGMHVSLGSTSVLNVLGFGFELLGGGLHFARRFLMFVAVWCYFLGFLRVLGFHWDN